MPRNINDVQEFLKSLFSFQSGDGIVKSFILATTAVGTYVFPTARLQETAIAAAGLVFLDTVTGLIKAFIIRKPRTSVCFARVLSKTFSYLSVCAVASVVERTILGNSGLSLTLGVLWLVIATEGISIIENVEKISGGRFRLLRAILGRVIDDDKEAASKEKTQNV